MRKVSRKYFEAFKQKHYELWDWLSKNPDKTKNDWFNSVYYVGTPKMDIVNSCFACEIAQQIREYDFGKSMCGYCPLRKSEEDYHNPCLNGLFDKYVRARGSERVKIAKQIRDLPWSEEYVEDKEMNNENYIVINGKKAELTKEQLKQLGIEVGKNKRWRAEENAVYYFTTDTGKVGVSREYLMDVDNIRYDTHNYFKTKEEAEEYIDVLEIKRQLMKFADEHNEPIDWDELNKPKRYLYLTRPTDEIVIGNTYREKIPEIIYFSSAAIAHQAIGTIGKDNIIKYLTYNY